MWALLNLPYLPYLPYLPSLPTLHTLRTLPTLSTLPTLPTFQICLKHRTPCIVQAGRKDDLYGGRCYV
jgi:hypothetical protein